MPYLYSTQNGVNRKFNVLGGSVEGVGRKLNNLWSVDSGVNRMIFSSHGGVASVIGSYKGSFSLNYDGTGHIGLSSGSTDERDCYIDVAFTFYTPIEIAENADIRLYMVNGSRRFMRDDFYFNIYGHKVGTDNDEYLHLGQDSSINISNSTLFLFECRNGGMFDQIKVNFHCTLKATHKDTAYARADIQEFIIGGYEMSGFTLI